MLYLVFTALRFLVNSFFAGEYAVVNGLHSLALAEVNGLETFVLTIVTCGRWLLAVGLLIDSLVLLLFAATAVLLTIEVAACCIANWLAG